MLQKPILFECFFFVKAYKYKWNTFINYAILPNSVHSMRKQNKMLCLKIGKTICNKIKKSNGLLAV